MTRRPCECVMLSLPRPISVNELFGNNKNGSGRGRYLTKEYAAWKEECGLVLNSQRPGRVDGAYALTIRVPAKWRGDLGNSEKAVSDLLQEHEIVKNDKLAERILLERWPEDFVQVMVVSTRAQA